MTIRTIRSTGPRFACAAVATAAVLALAGPAAASDPFVLDLPAGLACADFDLRIEGFGDANRVYREFTDKDGNVVRTLSTGTGDTLEYKNLATGTTYQSTSNGSVNHTVVNADGSTTSVLSGHNLVILFPTDFPPGPSTTLHTGQVVLEVDAAGTFTILKATGRALDICATLS
jgi:hypothetical protein